MILYLCKETFFSDLWKRNIEDFVAFCDDSFDVDFKLRVRFLLKEDKLFSGIFNFLIHNIIHKYAYIKNRIIIIDDDSSDISCKNKP